MATFKPLGNRVLVKRSKAPTSKGGILLPDSAQEKPREGDVIEVGPGKLDTHGKIESMSVKKGDRVLFGPYAGTEIKNTDGKADEELLILSEDDILGILTK